MVKENILNQPIKENSSTKYKQYKNKYLKKTIVKK